MEKTPLVRVELELLLEVLHVGVLDRVVHGAAEADAVDERGVDEAVGDDDVVLGQDGLEDAGVGVHAGGEEERVLGAEEGRQLVLELAVDVLGAADEAHRGHAVAAGLQAVVRRLDHVGVAREPQVVVGAHVDDLLEGRAGRELDLDVGRLGRVDVALLLEEPRVLDPLERRLITAADLVAIGHGPILSWPGISRQGRRSC
jgi:hypothetical protein